MPRYRQKLMEALTDEEFNDIMTHGRFVRQEHRGFVVFIYYSALRISEALKLRPKQFRISHNKKKMYVDVTIRLKGSKVTVPLPLPVQAPFMIDVLKTVENAIVRKQARVFPFCRTTGYYIVRRVYPEGYPHYFRLNRITQFFSDGFTIDKVRSWTGLSLAALEHYVGIVSVEKMGESLAKSIR